MKQNELKNYCYKLSLYILVHQLNKMPRHLKTCLTEKYLYI